MPKSVDALQCAPLRSAAASSAASFLELPSNAVHLLSDGRSVTSLFRRVFVFGLSTSLPPRAIRAKATTKINGMRQLSEPMLCFWKLKFEDMDGATKAAKKLQAWMRGGTKGYELQIEFEEKFYKECALANKEDPRGMRRPVVRRRHGRLQRVQHVHVRWRTL